MILIHMEGWGVCICGNLAFHPGLIAKVVILVSCWVLIRGGLCSVDRLVVHSSRPTRRVKIMTLVNRPVPSMSFFNAFVTNGILTLPHYLNC